MYVALVGDGSDAIIDDCQAGTCYWPLLSLVIVIVIDQHAVDDGGTSAEKQGGG